MEGAAEDLPPIPRCTTISSSGTGTAPWSASITRCTCGARGGGARSKPDGGDHQLAVREGRSKRGSWLDPSGYDAGKKIKGRKRHILVDTLGLLLNVVVHPADIQDRDGAFHLLRRARRLFPFIERIFADGAYAGRKMAMTVCRTGAWNLQIVKRSNAAGFEALPKRWIVERTFAWISRNRRLARDFERYATTVAAFIRLHLISSQPRYRLHSQMDPGACERTGQVAGREAAVPAERARGNRRMTRSGQHA